MLSLYIADAIKRFSDGDEIFEDDNLKCYMDCLLHEMGFILPDGKIDLVGLHESFNEDKEIHFTFIHMMRKCLYPAGEGCERAFNLNACFKKADPKVCWSLWRAGGWTPPIWHQSNHHPSLIKFAILRVFHSTAFLPRLKIYGKLGARCTFSFGGWQKKIRKLNIQPANPPTKPIRFYFNNRHLIKYV